ncbi:MAG TPA: hypothetical protein VGU02_15395 [Gaiellaceae bacterium]|nr:hypothetical protein [Gaiellaceae bacterium]
MLFVALLAKTPAAPNAGGQPLWEDVLAGVLATLIALAIGSAIKWLYERYRAKHPDFTCVARESERPPDEVIQANTTVYRRNVALTVNVINDGPTGDFYARLKNFSGMPSDNYQVPLPLWKHTTDTRTTIPGHGGQRVIELANVARVPPAIWFNTSESGTRQAGTQWRLSEDTEIDFVLEVGMVGERRDQLRNYAGRIVVSVDGVTPPTFTLTEA